MIALFYLHFKRIKVFFWWTHEQNFLGLSWRQQWLPRLVSVSSQEQNHLVTSISTNILQMVKFWPISWVLPQFSFLSLAATRRIWVQSPLHTAFPTLQPCISSSSAEHWFHLAVPFNIRIRTSTKAESDVISLYIIVIHHRRGQSRMFIALSSGFKLNKTLKYRQHPLQSSEPHFIGSITLCYVGAVKDVAFLLGKPVSH